MVVVRDQAACSQQIAHNIATYDIGNAKILHYALHINQAH
jgi:hypothetical protein